MAMNVIGQRMNFMVVLHGCWLVAILTRRHRAAIARLWPNYCLFLALFLLYQYLLCLGIPPALCMGERAAGTEGAGRAGRWLHPSPGGRCWPLLVPLPPSLFVFRTFPYEGFEAISKVGSSVSGAAMSSSGATQQSEPRTPRVGA